MPHRDRLELLDRYLDLPGDAPLGRVKSLPEVDAPATPWEAAVVENSPEVAVRRAEVLGCSPGHAPSGIWPSTHAANNWAPSSFFPWLPRVYLRAAPFSMIQ